MGSLSSLIRPLEDIAACGIPYWLPPGGRDNGVCADTWELITDLHSRYVRYLLGLLASSEIVGYAAIPNDKRDPCANPSVFTLNPHIQYTTNPYYQFNTTLPTPHQPPGKFVAMTRTR